MRKVIAIFLISIEILVLSVGIDVPKELGYPRLCETINYRIIRLQYETRQSHISFVYPAFDTMSLYPKRSESLNKLNKLIEEKVNELWKANEKEYLYVYNSISNSKDEFNKKMSIYYEVEFIIAAITFEFVSIIFHARMYLGGNHDSHYVLVLNYDIDKAKEVKLPDIFKSDVDYKSKINEIIKKRIISIDDPLKVPPNAYYYNKLPVADFKGMKDTDQVAITPYGLAVILQTYNVYSPYTHGFPIITIPYDMLDGFTEDFLKIIRDFRNLLNFHY